VLLEHDARYSDLDPSRRIGRDALVRWFEDARVAVERTRFGAELTGRMRLLLASTCSLPSASPAATASASP
jgi:acyl-CoA thioester hydrolase